MSDEGHLVHLLYQRFGYPQWINDRLAEVETQEDLPAGPECESKAPLKPLELPDDHLDLQKLPSINMQDDRKGLPPVLAGHFHPTTPMALVAGQDSRIQLFNVDAHANPRQDSFFLEGFRMKGATFSGCGSYILAWNAAHQVYRIPLDTRVPELVESFSGLTPPQTHHLRSWGPYFLICSGNQVLVCKTESMALVKAFRCNAKVIDAVFSPLRETLLVFDQDGLIYEYCLQTFGCLGKKGCPSGSLVSCLQVVPLDARSFYLLVGGDTGIVDFYRLEYGDSAGCLTSLGEAAYSSGNLVTSIAGMAVHPSQLVVALYSDQKEGALRLVHLPTLKVFPMAPLPVGKITAVSFSADQQYMSVADHHGGAHLYGLTYFARL